jgi:DNA-binding NarL/FixJ family response regulator
MMKNNQFSVFLVAGNRLLREALARLLAHKGNFYVCGISPCIPDVISSIVNSGTEVLILDSGSAHLSEYTFIKRLLGQAPSLKIILIDMDEDPEIFLECVRAGAVGYLLKSASAAEVVSGIRTVAGGQALCPLQFCMPLFRTVAQQWTARPSVRIKIELGLTRRQQQLVPLIAQGLTNKEIASQLNLSEQTVKNHIHRILRRVGANDRLGVAELTHRGVPIAYRNQSNVLD